MLGFVPPVNPFAVGLAVAGYIGSLLGAFDSPPPTLPPGLAGDVQIMSRKEHGTCAQPPGSSLRWGADSRTADRIACYNRDGAERAGYWEKTTFLTSESPASGEITFHDSITGKPLFIAPRGRSFGEFVAESRFHGWPSFRDQEVVSDNVRVLIDGETVSADGTHLGHNLPDAAGNRYCINIVSVSGQPQTAAAGSTQLVVAERPFKRVRTQFIAALGDPAATSGTGASSWGVWRLDPGPRGVRLSDYKGLAANGGEARAGWKFDPQDWWLEEHGLIMEKPEFPLPPGRYKVTGGRELTTVLTIGADGDSWSLEKGTLYDVTHLPCRSARYKPMQSDASPANAKPSDFPVKPGAAMPDVAGMARQDYAVVFVTAIA